MPAWVSISIGQYPLPTISMPTSIAHCGGSGKARPFGDVKCSTVDVGSSTSTVAVGSSSSDIGVAVAVAPTMITVLSVVFVFQAEIVAATVISDVCGAFLSNRMLEGLAWLLSDFASGDPVAVPRRARRDNDEMDFMVAWVGE